jgi:bacterioferritin-associated ferredoxin
MIICSCNAFSDHELRSTVAKAIRRPRVSQIYAELGGSAHREAPAIARKSDSQNDEVSATP